MIFSEPWGFLQTVNIFFGFFRSRIVYKNSNFSKYRNPNWLPEKQKSIKFAKFRNFFQKFEIFLTVSFLIWKGNLIFITLQKNHRNWTKDSKDIVLWGKNHKKIGFRKPIFNPWGYKWTPIFVLMCYYCSVLINK